MRWIAAGLAAMSLAAGPEEWAKRVDLEVARLEPPADGSTNDPAGLAVAAYSARPSEARRAVAGELIRKIAKASFDTADDCEGQMLPRLHAAALLAEVDDTDGARAMLEQARQVPPDFGQPVVPPEEMSPAETAFVLEVTGDADRFPEIRLKSGWMLESFFEIAEDRGKTELSDRLRRLISASPNADPDTENVLWSQVLADDGFYAQAMAVAEGVGKYDSRFGCELSVATTAAEKGDRQWIIRYRDNYLAEAKTNPNLRTWGPYVCRTLSQYADREGMDMVVAQAVLSKTPAEAATDHAGLAASFFALGETDKYDIQIKSAARALARVPDDVPANLALAAAYARAGDTASVGKRLAKVKAKLGRNDNDVFAMDLLESELQPIIEAYLEADLTKEAMAVADAKPDPIHRLAAGLTAHRLAKDGKFTDALKLVATLDPPCRLGIYCFVAREQVRQKSTAGLEKWIDALPAAYDRATLNIAVENAITGHRDRTFEQTTEERVTPNYDDADTAPNGEAPPNANGS